MSANAIQCAARFSIWCKSVQIRLRMPLYDLDATVERQQSFKLLC